ncbi:MAG: NAD-dependent epimerase/dehydratase family protein [Thiomonas sp.]|nr:NAD-dependent epimerase/dehydratase family protein [Thiomonas sp.]
MKTDSTILVTGAGGVLGAAILSELRKQGHETILAPTKAELNCLDEGDIERYFDRHRPTHVFHLASLVFGIKGNLQNQALSFKANTLMSLYVLDACAKYGVEKVFFAGTVASYAFPYISLPLQEKHFWMGAPHAGEYGYALAKRGSLGHLQILRQSFGMDFCYGIFTNLYGPHDKFNTETGHVIPSLVVKTVRAEAEADAVLEVWGKPQTTRDFLYADDAAQAAILAMEKHSGEINIASGLETTMGALVDALSKSATRTLQVKWVSDQPVGIPKRHCDVSRLQSLGFTLRYSLEAGIGETLQWYRANAWNART